MARLMERLLYWTWPGPTRQESRQSVEEQQRRISERKRELRKRYFEVRRRGAGGK